MASSSKPTFHRSVTIVTPCFNEELAVDPFWASLRRVLDEQRDREFTVVFVDDGSRDETLTRLQALAAEDARVRVLSFTRNFGHQIALSAGLDVADGAAVVLMDSDLQHPPELIPVLLERLDRGVDIVSAVRKATDDASFLKRASSDGYYTLFNALSDLKIPHGAADFVCLSRRAYCDLRGMRERHRLLRGMISWLGYPRDFVEYVAPPRVAGVSKYSLRKMVRLALDGVFSFSSQPIRYGIRVGFALSLFGAGYLAFVLYQSLVSQNAVRGWSSILATILVLGGFQICMIGLIGEYIARTFEESKGRPLYLLRYDSKQSDDSTSRGA